MFLYMIGCEVLPSFYVDVVDQIRLLVFKTQRSTFLIESLGFVLGWGKFVISTCLVRDKIISNFYIWITSFT
jgi:hypothetical protein